MQFSLRANFDSSEMDLLFIGYFETAKCSEDRRERIVQFANKKMPALVTIDLVILFLDLKI